MCSRRPAGSLSILPRSPGASIVTSTQKWTLAVVCAATAMLMLDIAVVNTALSDIAADLNTGLGLQWVVDACTLALAAVVLTAARSPTASVVGGCSRSVFRSSPSRRSCVRRRPTS